MAYVKLSAPPTIGNVTQNTGQFSTVGVGAAAVTSGLYVNVANRIGTWITGTTVSSGADTDGLFIDASFAPSANVGNAASIGLYPTFNPPGGVTITTGYGLYVASGTQGGAGAVTTGYGLFVTHPTFGTTNYAAQIDNLRIDLNSITATNANGTVSVLSDGTGGANFGTNATAHTTTVGSTTTTSTTIVQAGSGGVKLGTVIYPSAALSSGKILISDGTNIVGSTPTYPNTSGSAGVILRSDGTNNVYTTATYPATTTINRILYSSSNNIIGEITTANTGALVTSSAGVPSITTGTTGQILAAVTSGTPAFKTFQVVRQVFTTSGAGTYTPTSGMVYCDIEVVGGGGGGAGTVATGAATISCGGGGGGGGYSRKLFTAATIGASKSLSVGAGGSAGGSGTGGGTGGTTSVGSTLIQATGGVGGTASAALSYSPGGAGGVGTLGDFNTAGTPGNPGINWIIVGTTADEVGGNGGSSFFGGGGPGSHNTGTGTAGQSYGGGGGGSSNNTSQSARVGSAGADGIVIVTEYVLA